MECILDVLQEVADIAHWTVLPAHWDPCGEERSCPPFIAWRYKHPTSELEEFFRCAIRSFQGTIQWEFYTMGARWVLMPARLRVYSDSCGDIGPMAAAEELKVTDPDFGRGANAELRLLAEHIRYQNSKAHSEVSTYN